MKNKEITMENITMKKIAYLALGLSLGLFFMTLAQARVELNEYRQAQNVKVPAVLFSAMNNKR